MKKSIVSIVICLLFVLIVVSLTIRFMNNNSKKVNKTSAVAFGIEAKVIDVFDNHCNVIVTGRDPNFNKNEIVTVYYKSIYKELDEMLYGVRKKEKTDLLSKGDIVSITYFKYKKKNNFNTINTKYVLIRY